MDLQNNNNSETNIVQTQIAAIYIDIIYKHGSNTQRT